MRPNTPHVVFTPEPSVCTGGHFYATSTLRETCYGLYHDFVVGRVSTNTQHVQDTFRILTRMMAFYEVDLVGSEGVQLPENMNIEIGRFC